MKEALREKLELEQRALQVVERLLDDSVTEEFLIDCVSMQTHFTQHISHRSPDQPQLSSVTAPS